MGAFACKFAGICTDTVGTSPALQCINVYPEILEIDNLPGQAAPPGSDMEVCEIGQQSTLSMPEGWNIKRVGFGGYRCSC